MSNEKISGKSFVNLRLLKKIGIIGLIASSVAIVIIAIFALLQLSGKSFTVQFDNPIETPHLKLATRVDGSDENTFFVGTPVQNANQATGSEVYSKIDEIASLDDLSGSQNLDAYDENGEKTKYQMAQVFTIYLTSTADEEETFNVSLNIDGLDNPVNTNSPIEYYRAMFITSDVTDSRDAHVNVASTVYGQKTKTGMPTAEGSEDYRECLSSYSRVPGEEGKTARKADEDSKINGQSYCEPFMSTSVNETMVKHPVKVGSMKTVRLTFVGYFEGFDPDGYGQAPEKAYLLLSLHIGK